MPALPSVDVPIRSHHWHGRQSISQPSSSNDSTTIGIIVAVVLVLVIIFAVCVARCAKDLRMPSYVAPRSMVQAPLCSQSGPVIAEILANQALVVPPGEATGDIPTTMSSSAPIDAQNLSRAMDGPSQLTQADRSLLVNENVPGSRTGFDAGVGQADEPPRTVIIHEDGGHVLHVDEAELGGLPPGTVITRHDDDRMSQVDAAGPIDLPPPYSSIPLP